MGLSLVQSFGALSQSSSQSIVDQGVLDNLLKSSLYAHRTRLVGGLDGLDLGGGSSGIGTGFRSSVRHFGIAFVHWMFWRRCKG